jgi:hypothetical protein
VLIILVQVAEIIHRYDVDCVPNAYRGNRQAYIKDSSILKNCTLQAKVKLLCDCNISYLYFVHFLQTIFLLL